MESIVSEYEYTIAWTVYVVAGVMFCLFWWKMTSLLNHAGWRDLLRGIVLVVIYTPWFAGDPREHFAPATLVVLMDLLLGSTENGLAASLALLIATALMLAALIVKRLLKRSSS
jgi:hypothetical protein